MTVKELRDLLANYDDDRPIYAIAGFPFPLAGVRSLEPAGPVILSLGSMLSMSDILDVADPKPGWA